MHPVAAATVPGAALIEASQIKMPHPIEKTNQHSDLGKTA
jgi:hypothetical protein